MKKINFWTPSTFKYWSPFSLWYAMRFGIFNMLETTLFYVAILIIFFVLLTEHFPLDKLLMVLWCVITLSSFAGGFLYGSNEVNSQDKVLLGRVLRVLFGLMALIAVLTLLPWNFLRSLLINDSTQSIIMAQKYLSQIDTPANLLGIYLLAGMYLLFFISVAPFKNRSQK